MADNLLDRLARAVTPQDTANSVDGPHFLSVDARGGFLSTQWPISLGASGATTVIGNPGAGKRVYVSSFTVTPTQSVTFQINSPSGTPVSGSFNVLPGGLLNMPGAMPNAPVFMSSTAAPIVLNCVGSGSIGGHATGWTA